MSLVRRVHDRFGNAPDPDPQYGAGEVTVTEVTEGDIDGVTDTAGWRSLHVYDGAGEDAAVYLSPADCAAIAAALTDQM